MPTYSFRPIARLIIFYSILYRQGYKARRAPHLAKLVMHRSSPMTTATRAREAGEAAGWSPAAHVVAAMHASCTSSSLCLHTLYWLWLLVVLLCCRVSSPALRWATACLLDACSPDVVLRRPYIPACSKHMIHSMHVSVSSSCSSSRAITLSAAQMLAIYICR